ncbi:MAG: hypothetical protein M1816_002185 [Peltula sp. TS41687]|nr:MAG: hypothetical protein M1816_002185 [Peltula sp. TS41687]
MPDPDLTYFQSIPWCAELLASPDLAIPPSLSRQPKASTEDALFASTLKSDATIRAYLAFHKRPVAARAARVDELHTLLSLGDGVNGYPHVCHGGIISTIMDEVMGSLLVANVRVGNHEIGADPVTASMKVTYLKPVATPQTVVVTARLSEIRGRRKYVVEASLKDGQGTVLAKAESVWIGLVRNSSEKL